MFKKETYMARREQLRKDVGHGLIIIPGNHEAPCNYKDNTYWFRQDSTFLYFFGLQREDMVGVLDCETGKDYIYANDYDIDDIIWTGPLPSVKELAAMVGVENTAPLKTLRDKIYAMRSPTCDTPMPLYLPPYRADIRADLAELIGLKYATVDSHASKELVLACVKQRMIKSAEEIEEIERAIGTAYNMHVGAMKMAMPGRYEYELAGFMEGEAWKGNGPVSFPVAMTMITTMVILAVTSNVVLSLGMVGALSIVRFRTAIKEPMDIAFLFWAIAGGIVLAAGMIPLAIVGSVIIGLIMIVFCNRKTIEKPFIAVITCRDGEAEKRVGQYLTSQVKKAVVKSKSAQKGNIELSYEVSRKSDDTAFITALSDMDGVESAVLVSYNGDYMG